MDIQSTNETSVRVARYNNVSLTRKDTEVLIQSAACMSTSEDNNNGVGVKADTV